jgi:hypothetical protein
MDIPCGIDGIHPHSMWNWWNPSSFHVEQVESMWNPYGIHTIIPCGIQVDIPSFHVESGHSITSPSGIQVEWRPQIEGDLSQNIFHMRSWNPHGIHVELDGIHMDSMWNVGGE